MAIEQAKKRPTVTLFAHQNSYMLRIPITEINEQTGKPEKVFQRDGNGQHELNVYNRRILAKKDIPFKEFTRQDYHIQSNNTSMTDWWCNLILIGDDQKDIPINEDYDAILEEFERLHKKPGQKLYTEQEYYEYINPEAVKAQKAAMQIADGKIKEVTGKLEQTQSELEKYKKMYEDSQRNRNSR
jgi:hypothetical protein